MAIQRIKSPSGATRPLGKQSLNRLSLGLSLDERLTFFIRHTLRKHSKGCNLLLQVATECGQILDRLCRQDVHSSQSIRRRRDHILSEIDEILTSLILSATHLPPTLVFEVHSLRGLIQDELERKSLAKVSYMKALWVASLASQVPHEQRVLVMHHLAKALCATGNHEEAVGLLEKVIFEYDRLKVPRRHPCVADARFFILSVHGRRLEVLSSCARKELRRLSRILEEDETEIYRTV
jgi:hypothetical protein